MPGNLVEILQDEYGSHSPYGIKAHPPGRRLYWKSKDLMLRRGDRGWIPVKKGDGIYEKLNQYINESPLKYMQSTDTTVQRGDNILCWKPLGSWLAGKLESAKKANMLQKQHQATMAGMQEYDPWGPGPEVFTTKKDPTKLETIMAGYGIAPTELDCPEADPRNYVQKDLDSVVNLKPGDVELSSDVEPTPELVQPVKRGPGRPKKK